MAQRPRHDLKRRINHSSKGFHSVEDKDLAGQLDNQLAELLVATGDAGGVGEACQSYVLDFGLRVFSSWFGALAVFLTLYLLLGVDNSNAWDSCICCVAQSVYADIKSGAKQQAVHGMVLCGDIMLTPNLSLSMATADNMAAQWEKVRNKLGSLKALLPRCYWYISNFMLDCVVLLCAFPLDAGLWRVDAVSGEIPIPFVCFLQIIPSECRLWLQAATFWFAEGRKFSFVSLWSLRQVVKRSQRESTQVAVSKGDEENPEYQEGNP